MAQLGSWGKALAAADIPAQREVLAELIQQVVPIRIRRGHYRIQITWMPAGEALHEYAETKREVA
jgi:hypothetical protein